LAFLCCFERDYLAAEAAGADASAAEATGAEATGAEASTAAGADASAAEAAGAVELSLCEHATNANPATKTAKIFFIMNLPFKLKFLCIAVIP
jgi:hypothetical protein